MDDNDLVLDLDNAEANAEEKQKVKNRFEKLSTDVILKSKERDDALAKAKAEEEARLNAEKERDFYKDFSTFSSKYPAAAEYQAQIWEKRKAGYEVEDAMVAVLNKEGKLNGAMPQQTYPAPQAEGGSSPTIFAGDKSIENMSRDEKLNALREADKTGELARALMGR